MSESSEEPTSQPDGEPQAELGHPARRRPNRWIVPLVLLVGLVVAVTLIVTGGDDSSTASASTTTTLPSVTTTLPARPLPWLGTFPDDQALRVQIVGLDRMTLQPASTAPGSSVATPPTQAPTAADAQRCARGITMTSTDALGSFLAAAGAQLGSTQVLVATYEVPASADHQSAVRAFVVDAASCRVLSAIEFPA